MSTTYQHISAVNETLNWSDKLRLTPSLFPSNTMLKQMCSWNLQLRVQEASDTYGVNRKSQSHQLLFDTWQ